ncbi:hypothetical protein L208DRAFT_1382280 [Tricholoma matsutake]|nr:hypothetical protein L208DRAFT_1382280 [Tricholoma matsutake 945]
MPRNKLNKSYIIDMETIVETFWAALNTNQVDNWLQEVETPWCVMQKNTSFHSEMVLEMAIRKGDLDIKELAVQITDWDSEADLLVNIGFPGSTLFDDEPGEPEVLFIKPDTQIDFKSIIGDESRMDIDNMSKGKTMVPKILDVGLQEESSSQRTLIIKDFVQRANQEKENEQEKEEEGEEGGGVEEEEMDSD